MRGKAEDGFLARPGGSNASKRSKGFLLKDYFPSPWTRFQEGIIVTTRDLVIREGRKMPMRCLILFLIPVIAFSISCSPYVVGTPIEKTKVVQIVPGTTHEPR
jgi:hypothetical protein